MLRLLSPAITILKKTKPSLIEREKKDDTLIVAAGPPTDVPMLELIKLLKPIPQLQVADFFCGKCGRMNT